MTADPGQAPSLDVSKDEDYVIIRYAWFHALEWIGIANYPKVSTLSNFQFAMAEVRNARSVNDLCLKSALSSIFISVLWIGPAKSSLALQTSLYATPDVRPWDKGRTLERSGIGKVLKSFLFKIALFKIPHSLGL